MIKYFLIILFLSVLQPSFSQNSETFQAQPFSVSLIVSNADSASSWYQKVLGLKVLGMNELESRGIKIINLSNDQTIIELIQLEGSIDCKDSNDTNARFQGIFKFGFELNLFEEWLKSTDKMIPGIQDNVVTDPLTNRRMVVITDPDGNRLQLFEKLAK